MEKISAYIIIYHDNQFINDIINGIYDFIDEIIIVDGCFKYCLDILKKLNLFYESNNIFSKYTKVKYFSNIWENEKEKRMFGYNQCSNDIVLLVDSDEFFVLDKKNIIDFVNSDKYVAGFDIYNMNRININFDDKSRKNILFKKQYINAHQHLSYTWLVGVKDLELQNNNYIFENSMGTIYHQTLNRNKFNTIIKFIFYSRLWYLINDINKIDELYGYKVDFLLQKISIEDIYNIFYHSYLSPQNKILQLNENNIVPKIYNTNHLDGYLKPSTLLQNVNYYFYIDNPNICIQFENVKSCVIELYEIALDKLYYKHTKNYDVEDNKINILFDTQYDKCIEYVICFNCVMINDVIGKIISIENI
jgi:hypothetical protein